MPKSTSTRSRILAGAAIGGLLLSTSFVAGGHAEELTIPSPRIAQGDMLIPNHSFEDGLANWTPTNGRGGPTSKHCTNAATTDAAGATDLGSAALMPGSPPCVNTGLLSSPVGEVVPGEAYTVFADADGTGRASLGFRWLDEDGRTIDSIHSDRMAPAPRMEFTATAPAGATQVSVELGAHKTISFDDVRITAPYTNVGPQVTRRGTFLGQWAGYDEDGRAVMFAVTTGNAHQAAVLVVTDILTAEVTATVDLEGATGAWTIAQVPDGTVYVGTYQGPALYAWTPGEDEAHRIGTPPLDVFGMTYSIRPAPDGTIYGGGWGEPAEGYEGAQLWSYHPDRGFSKFGDTLRTDAFYTTAVGYDDVSNSVWAGTGSKPGLYGCTVEDEACTDYSHLLGDRIMEQPWVYFMRAGGGYVQAWGGDTGSVGNDTLVILKVDRDEAGELLVEKVGEIPEVIYPGGSEIIDGKVYYALRGTGLDLYSYDVETGAQEKEATIGIFARSWDFVDLRDPEWPGQTVMGWTSGGHMVAYNIETGKLKSILVEDIPMMSTGLNAFSDGPDGRIWSSGYLTGALGVVTPMRDDRQETYVVGFQSEGMTQHNGRVYQGIYPYGQVESFTPEEITSGGSPRIDCVIGHEQNRPYALHGKDDRMYFGSQATNNATKGAFGWLDIETGECTTFSEEVGHYSINALTSAGDKVFGGPNIYYSWDGLPFEDEAYLLAYDETTNAIEHLDLPVEGLRAVSGLVTDNSGIVWAYAEGWLLGLDPESMTWIHVEEIFPDWKPPQRISGHYSDMLMHPDGRIYGFAAYRMFAFDPEDTLSKDSAASSLSILYQDRMLWLKFDEYGNLWTIHDQTQLMRINPRAIFDE